MADFDRDSGLKRLLFIPLVLITVYAFAKNISAPPPLKEEPVAEQHYFRELYDNWNNLEETTTNPNGNRIGKSGDMVLYKNNLLEFFITVNIDSAFHWWAVKLEDLL
ncbi:hypothetical protein LCGC14_0435050 [marine sediment metagenome]|uniref:Uncharacterized protein n=1 Tax=marine sediment metagenome TaxID=412755 RepID=A0A0F9VWC5_9ZZZZ